MVFDPNAAATKNSGIFGLPYTLEEAALVLLPVPWEATTSYGGGTAQGPEAILAASKQVDLYDADLGNFYTAGIAMAEIPNMVSVWNDQAKSLAVPVIAAGGAGKDPALQASVDQVNRLSEQLNQYVYAQTKAYLSQAKRIGIVGGDHSTPFGAIQALLEVYPELGILHIDAHADMRKAYEGFEYSHASIFFNVLTKTPLNKLVQVGIRDFCEEELYFIKKQKTRVNTFFDAALFEKKMQGANWSALCDEIIDPLPKEVYISFDIDGLDPRYCPHTGTPVPGGLDFYEAIYLMKAIHKSGRKMVGFDLNEVSPGTTLTNTENAFHDTAAEWDANVAARLLYKLCGYTLA